MVDIKEEGANQLVLGNMPCKTECFLSGIAQIASGGSTAKVAFWLKLRSLLTTSGSAVVLPYLSLITDEVWNRVILVGFETQKARL